MQTEYELQKECVLFIKQEYPALLFCATLGGIRCGIKQRAKIQGSGYVKGVPDLIIFTPTKRCHHGCGIEFKSIKGRLSEYQKGWRDNLQEIGWAWYEVRTIEDFRAIMERLYR